jgi:class 3 adenylate cyclase
MRGRGTRGGTQVSGSVQLATILLTDLVGSTKLASEIGPARTDELRDEFFGLMREAATATGGREFKNSGDGMWVAFASASAAVGCSVLIHQLVERRYRHAEHRLHVRIGLGAGETTFQDDDYHGMPSVEAARLCDKASADGTLVTAAVRLLAGRTNGVEFEPAGVLELKGIPAPVEAFAVPWCPLEPESVAPDEVSRAPLPSILRSVPAVAYVGRSAELMLIGKARAAAQGGARQLVLVSGEPGIGKTRLASYSAHESYAEGFVVAWGACSEELSAPYEPWIQTCTHLVEHAREDLLAGYAGQHGGELTRLAPNLPARLPGIAAARASDPETERLFLFDAVAAFIGHLAADGPVCLVLDDFQWADAQSVALLKHVVRTVDRGALLLIVTYRDSDLTRGHPLTGVLADLRRVDHVHRLALSGLGAVEVAEVMNAVTGGQFGAGDEGLAAEIAAETNGNPFFVGEIVRHLWDSGTLSEMSHAGDAGPSARPELPESVRDVVDRRIDRLGDQSREVLTAAAVIGRSFDVDLLSRVAGVSPGQLLDVLEAAVSAFVLAESADEVGRFGFAHGLISQALYERLGTTRRAWMHHRVATSLEELRGDDPAAQAEAVAHHCRAGRWEMEEMAPAQARESFARAHSIAAAS